MSSALIDDANDIYLLPALVLSSSQADAAAYEAVDAGEDRYYGNSRRSNRSSYRRGYYRGATNSWSRSDRNDFRNDVRDRCRDRYGR